MRSRNSDGLERNESLSILSRWQFQAVDLRRGHVGFHLESKRHETLIHLLEPRKVFVPNRKPITKQAFDITLTMHFRVSAAVAHREANPAHGVPFHKAGVILLGKKVWHPAVRPPA